MNINEYNGDPRYWAVWEKMQLLQIEDVSTKRQDKNGTIVWKLPIKNNWPGNQANATYIEVASFKTGYVRNQNSGYSNYQLNKRCDSEPQYYKSVAKNGDYDKDWCGKPLYTQYTTRTCKLIPIEIDRLEYLISYCLKNYYIKHANFVADGEYVPKWTHEWELSKAEEAVMNSYEPEDCGHYERIRDLENKLDTIKRIAEY